MPLSNEQIERYSRQIILPQIGGRGQERLLAARIAIAGEIAELETPLAYLVGAGVGTIVVDAVDDENGAQGDALIDEMRGLNPEVNLRRTSSPLGDFDLCVILVGSARTRAAAEAMNVEPRTGALIVARLDRPGEVVIIPSRPPCLACGTDVDGKVSYSAANVDLIKMVATTEALKHLIQPQMEPLIIKFNGLSSVAKALVANPDCIICTQIGARKGQK